MGLQGDCLEKEQHQMKRDLAKAMADSNQVRDAYINKEQDKFFHHLNRQRSDIDSLKERLEQLELRVRGLELMNESMSEQIDSMAAKLCLCAQAEATSQMWEMLFWSFIHLTDPIFLAGGPSGV